MFKWKVIKELIKYWFYSKQRPEKVKEPEVTEEVIEKYESRAGYYYDRSDRFQKTVKERKLKASGGVFEEALIIEDMEKAFSEILATPQIVKVIHRDESGCKTYHEDKRIAERKKRREELVICTPIIPTSFESEEDKSNLQPLWAKENLHKGKKYDRA
jgi:hypothetical protein